MHFKKHISCCLGEFTCQFLRHTKRSFEKVRDHPPVAPVLLPAPSTYFCLCRVVPKESGGSPSRRGTLAGPPADQGPPGDVLHLAPPPQYCIWIDGLSALLGKDMSSELTKSDLDTLLSMEMKLRLLDLENIQIPEAPPPVPKEPSSYDFVYHYG